jgi:hypothetical protein
MNLSIVNEEMARRSTLDCPMANYQVIKNKDCFFIVDREGCPVGLSTVRWSLDFIPESVARGYDLEDWMREIETLVRAGMAQP